MENNVPMLNFIKNSTLLNFKSTIYLCDNEKCYIKASNGKIEFCKNNGIDLSNNLKKLLKHSKDCIVKKNVSYDITKDSSKTKYSGFMINVVNSNYFLISTNIFISFRENNIEYAKTTCEFLNKMIK